MTQYAGETGSWYVDIDSKVGQIDREGTVTTWRAEIRASLLPRGRHEVRNMAGEVVFDYQS